MKKEKPWIDFLIANCIYPYISKNGKVFFKGRASSTIPTEMKEEILSSLNLIDKKECEKIREIVKEQCRKKRSKSIKHWMKGERPREMLIKNGPGNLPLSKLMAILLRTGKEGKSAEELGRVLLNTFGSLRGIDSASIDEISSVEGIGMAKATQIKAAFEIGKRLYREKAEVRKKLNSPQDVVDYVREFYAPYLRDARKEFFNIVLLDTRNKVVENIEMSTGNVSSSFVDPGEIIRIATSKSAAGIILIHNHPSGEPDPSEDDIKITNIIVKACKLVGIKVLDHIIIGKNYEDFISLYSMGIIEE